MTRPAVVWDMGGIMYRYFTEVLLDRAAAESWPIDGLPLGPTRPAPDPDYEAMDRGDIDEREYLAVVRARLATVGVDVDPVATIDWSQQSRPETWRVIAAAHRAGHPQALLTNDASTWLGARWWETWEPASWFDELVDVTVVGVRKPAPEPYLAAARALDLPTSACLFVDDMRVNCAGAEAVGMASHHLDVRDPAGSLSALAHRLGLQLEPA
jgi:putative hydrolase of the HAD superfamily